MDDKDVLVLSSPTGKVGISFSRDSFYSGVRCGKCGKEFVAARFPQDVWKDGDDYWAGNNRFIRKCGWLNEQGKIEAKCGCGIRIIDPDVVTARLRPGEFSDRGSTAIALVFSLLDANWIGFYGSPDSQDEDVAIIYFGDIPDSVRKQWTDIRKLLVDASCVHSLDPIIVSVKDGNVTEVMGADPEWPHPKEDVQNCLYQTVLELADRINYILPEKRNVEEKIIQCKAWMDYFKRNPVDPKRRTPPYAIWDLWSKRAGFIGIQLFALKRGQDAGYTKESVRKWAEKNIKMMDGRPLPPTDHPGRDRHHDFSKTRDFLEAVLNDSDTEFRLVSGPVVDGDGEVRKDEWWEPYTPIFEPLKFKTVKRDLGVCALCGKGLSSDESIYPAQIFFSKIFVHTACAKKIAENLIDLSDGNCHLEFGKDGTPYWVWGSCFSSSRIEYSVWDKDWNLVERSSGGPEHPLER